MYRGAGRVKSVFLQAAGLCPVVRSTQLPVISMGFTSGETCVPEQGYSTLHPATFNRDGHAQGHPSERIPHVNEVIGRAGGTPVEELKAKSEQLASGGRRGGGCCLLLEAASTRCGSAWICSFDHAAPPKAGRQ